MERDEFRWASSVYCRWEGCRVTRTDDGFRTLSDLLAHVKRHCAESKPVHRATYESQESYDSGSHLPPRIQQLRPEQPSVRPNNPAGLDSQIDVTSFMQSIEPSMSHSQVAIREPLYQDELPPPELSAPPASIPFVQSQQEIPSEEQLFQHYIAEPSSEPGDSEQIAVTIAPNSASSKEADAGTALQDRDGAFTFNFSQDPDAFDRSPRLAHVSDSNLEKVTEETEPETFGIHASQVMELDAFTQV